MEEFEKIDWLPNVEDIIDDKFIDEERLKKESSMYSLMNGTFEDPFVDVRQNNYTPFKKESPKKVNQNAGKNKPSKKANQNQNTMGSSQDTPKKPRGRPKRKKD